MKLCYLQELIAFRLCSRSSFGWQRRCCRKTVIAKEVRTRKADDRLTIILL